MNAPLRPSDFQGELLVALVVTVIYTIGAKVRVYSDTHTLRFHWQDVEVALWSLVSHCCTGDRRVVRGESDLSDRTAKSEVAIAAADSGGDIGCGFAVGCAGTLSGQRDELRRMEFILLRKRVRGHAHPVGVLGGRAIPGAENGGILTGDRNEELSSGQAVVTWVVMGIAHPARARIALADWRRRLEWLCRKRRGTAVLDRDEPVRISPAAGAGKLFGCRHRGNAAGQRFSSTRDCKPRRFSGASRWARPMTRFRSSSRSMAPATPRSCWRITCWATAAEKFAATCAASCGNTPISATRARKRKFDWSTTSLSTQGARPNIFVFVIDAMRPDYLGAYNPRVDYTPNLDAFARDSVVLHHAYSQYAGTSLSEPALWAGAMMLHAHYLQPFSNVNGLEKMLRADDYHMVVSMDEVVKEILSPSDDLVKLDMDKQLWNHLEIGSTVQQAESALDRTREFAGAVFFYDQPKNVHQFARNDVPSPTSQHWQAPGRG